jgi:hypothetical protein
MCADWGMPFPISASETVIAGGLGPSDVTSCARWLEADLRRNRATSVSIGDRVVRFRSVLTLGGPLWGFGGGVLDLREAGETGKIRVNLSFVPLVIVVAGLVTVSVASTYTPQRLGEDIVLWFALFLLLFGPCYLLLPARFCQFVEESLKRYYDSRARPS